MFLLVRNKMPAMFIIIAQIMIFLVGNLAVYISNRACEYHYQPGSVLIGGIFSTYTTDQVSCDGTYWISVISKVESMSYAIRLINQREDILPNVTLGFYIRNNCGDDDLTLWTMLTMVSPSAGVDYEKKCPGFEQKVSSRIIGIVGPSRSAASLVAAKVANVYAVPMISYFATSDELSDSQRFPYFLRTVPPDKFQVSAILDLLLRFDWKYIALFYSIDSYGTNGAQQIQKLAQDLDICIAVNLPVSSSPSEVEIQDIANKLIESDKIKVIVMFSVVRPAHMVLKAITENIIDRQFTFLGSDAWGGDVIDIDDAQSKLLHGSLFIKLFQQPIPHFRDYYKQLPHNQHLASKWYEQLLQIIKEVYNCSRWDSCPVPQAHNEIYVINSVFAFAIALHNSITNNCQTDVVCEEAVNGDTYLKHLKNVTFEGPGGRFEFDVNGDTSGKYVIKSWQLDNGVYKMVDVGFWDPDHPHDRLQIDEDIIQWNGMTDGTPTSLCVEVCGPNEIAVPLKKKCCWGCQRCPKHAIRVNHSCRECPNLEWPNDKFSHCIPIHPDYVDSQNPIVMVNVAVSSFGILQCALTILGIWIYRKNQLIKASSIELSYVNLTGLIMGCLASLSTTSRPSSISCRVSEALIALSFSFIFAPVLMKVNRIWRIFQAGSNSMQRPRYVRPKEQLTLTTMLILGQVRRYVFVLFHDYESLNVRSSDSITN